MSEQALADVAGNRYVLTGISDTDLLSSTRRLVGCSNQLFADLLAHLAEVEARGIHRTRRCASLYTYCIYELRLSEDAAFRRVSAARLVKTFPALFDAVASGELHLTGLLMLGPHLTQANLHEVLARAKHRTKKELARLIRQLDPLPDVPPRIEPLGPAPSPGPSIAAARSPTYQEFVQSLVPIRELPAGERPRDWIDEATTPAESDDQREIPRWKEAPAAAEPEPAKARWAPVQPPPLRGPERYGVQFTATAEYVELVERAKALLSSSGACSSLEELHLRAMQALVAELEKRKYAVNNQPAVPQPRAEVAEAAPGPRDPESPRQRDKKRSRHIPATIRRDVYLRDAARCTYTDGSGRRCLETHHLQLHHLKAFAHRGEHSVENIALRCRAHNCLSAEADFGREHIERKQASTAHEALHRQRGP